MGMLKSSSSLHAVRADIANASKSIVKIFRFFISIVLKVTSANIMFFCLDCSLSDIKKRKNVSF